MIIDAITLMQVNFYQLTLSPLDKVLPKLLEQIITQKHNRVLLVCPDKSTMRKMDALLWTFAQLSFLPHATEDDPMPEEQPILLTTSAELNLNSANIICTLTYQTPQIKFEKLLIMFEQDDLSKIIQIKKLHAELQKEDSLQFNYFIQNSSGWQKTKETPF
jgi:DNA polymerase-3 subunit chi